MDFYHVRTHEQTPGLIYHFMWLPTRTDSAHTRIHSLSLSIPLNNSHTKFRKERPFLLATLKCLPKYQRNISWFERKWCDVYVCCDILSMPKPLYFAQSYIQTHIHTVAYTKASSVHTPSKNCWQALLLLDGTSIFRTKKKYYFRFSHHVWVIFIIAFYLI